MIWLLKIGVDLLGNLAAVLLAPLAAFTANVSTGRLLWVFRWMETPDTKLPGDFSVVAACYRRFGWRITAWYWLTRNKAYGLSSWLRVKPTKEMARSFKGNPLVSDVGPVYGWCWFRIGPWREFYGVFGKAWFIRIRVGYKLAPFFGDGEETPVWGTPVLHFSLRKA